MKSKILFKSPIPLLAKELSFSNKEIFSKLKDLFFNNFSSFDIETS